MIRGFVLFIWEQYIVDINISSRITVAIDDGVVPGAHHIIILRNTSNPGNLNHSLSASAVPRVCLEYAIGVGFYFPVNSFPL